MRDSATSMQRQTSAAHTLLRKPDETSRESGQWTLGQKCGSVRLLLEEARLSATHPLTSTIASEIFASGCSPNYIRSQLKAAAAVSSLEFEEVRKQLTRAEENLATARSHAAFLKRVGTVSSANGHDDPGHVAIQQAELGASLLIPCVDEVDRLKKLHTEAMLERDQRSKAVACTGGHSHAIDFPSWTAFAAGSSSNSATRLSYTASRCDASPFEPSGSRPTNLAAPSVDYWQERVDGSQDICRRCNGDQIGCQWLQEVLDANSLDEELLWFEASQQSVMRNRDAHAVTISLHVRPRAPVVLRERPGEIIRSKPSTGFRGRSSDDEIPAARDEQVASPAQVEPRLVTKATKREWDIKRIVPRDMYDLDALSLLEVLHAIRALVSNLNEAMFYVHVAQLLGDVPIVRSRAVDFECQLERTVAAAAAVATEPEIARQGLVECGFVFISDHVDTRIYVQKSPLNVHETHAALTALAKIHAAAWTGTHAMGMVQQWLHSEAGWWSLTRRGTVVDESHRIKQSMLRVTAELETEIPELFVGSARALGDRLAKRIDWIDAAIHGAAARKFFTLVHGNCGAATSLHIRKELMGDGLDALVKGFEWAGVGVGMRDVAYLLSHSGPLDVMSQLEPISFTGARSAHASVSERELALVKCYHEQVTIQLRMQQQLPAAEAYTFDVALAHYKLCVLDVGRVILSHFYRDFSAQLLLGNTKVASLPIACRTRDCAVRFVQRLDSILAEYEDRFGPTEPWPL